MAPCDILDTHARHGAVLLCCRHATGTIGVFGRWCCLCGSDGKVTITVTVGSRLQFQFNFLSYRVCVLVFQARVEHSELYASVSALLTRKHHL